MSVTTPCGLSWHLGGLKTDTQEVSLTKRSFDWSKPAVTYIINNGCLWSFRCFKVYMQSMIPVLSLQSHTAWLL